jgi:hypothetical protein
LNPFDLAKTIEVKLERLFKLANRRHSPGVPVAENSGARAGNPVTQVEKETMKALSGIFPGLTCHIRYSKQKKK